MIIKTDDGRVFINLDELDAIWSDDYRRDHYNVAVGAQSFEVSRPVADAIFAELEKCENELNHIREMSETVGQWIGRAAKAEGDIVELRNAFNAVLDQWSSDTLGQANDTLVYKLAAALIKGEESPLNPPNQVTS
jgi:hypothetical protein